MWRMPRSSPLPMAAIGDPPDASTPTAANWVAPVNTNNDIAHAIDAETPALVATTPNDTPNTVTANPSVIAVRRAAGGVGIAAD